MRPSTLKNSWPTVRWWSGSRNWWTTCLIRKMRSCDASTSTATTWTPSRRRSAAVAHGSAVSTPGRSASWPHVCGAKRAIRPAKLAWARGPCHNWLRHRWAVPLPSRVGPPRQEPNIMKERVIVAMSGGVDSSVAAARLLEQGYDVIGVTLHLWDYPDDGSVKGRCCAPEDVHDARRVADALGFPHYAFDRRELFQREVVTPFVDSYLEGETPSPCVRCNRGVKIKELMALADKLDASRVATGHYARLVEA